MERISATYAMEWSIELEKALRSKKPGRAVEAIKQIGPRLEQWSREPVPTMPVYDMFGLTVGEDRLFANTILLRLADAFRLGDKELSYSIVRIFLSERKSRETGKKTIPYKGILSKERVANQEELLKRVKIVFDKGDVELRALALALFGCWAHFAKDSAHIRYLILSSLVSSIELEVKASIFAAGCFCQLADDFASVTLEMLHRVIVSPETSSAVRVAGARVFAKMGCSFSIADKAFKTGLKLLLDSSEEKFTVTMLVSLSRLASHSILLMAKQVDMLISFLNHGKSLRMQTMAIRCLHFVFSNRVPHFGFGKHAIEALVRVVGKTELPLAIKFEAVNVLKKVILCRQPNLSGDSIPENTHLLTMVKNLINSPARLKNLQSIHVLVDMMKIKGFNGDHGTSLFTEIVSIIMDRVFFFVKQLVDLCQWSERNFQGVHSLLSLLLLLLREDPELGVLALERSRLVVEYLCCEVLGATRDKITEIKEKLVCSFHKFLVTLVEILDDGTGVTYQAINKVNLLVKIVQQCNLFGGYVHVLYSLLLQSHVSWSFLFADSNEISCDKSLVNLLSDCLIEQNVVSFLRVKDLLTQKSMWLAYKAAILAACNGAWPTAGFIFDNLTIGVHTELYACWLKSLAQFARSESEIQLFLLPKLKTSLEEKLQMKYSSDVSLSEQNYVEVLAQAHNSLCSSVETMKSISALGRSFWFQRWFLSARAKSLGNTVDVLKTLVSIPVNQESGSGNGVLHNGATSKSLEAPKQLRPLSIQMMRLAYEYDLMATSCIEMDSRDTKAIRELALCCSLLAFTVGFAHFISDSSLLETTPARGLGSSDDGLKTILVQNLVTRLQHVDQETCLTLTSLLDANARPEHCLHLPPVCPISKIDGDMRAILNICTFAASEIVSLQGKSRGLHNREDVFHLTKDGFQLLLKTVIKWMHVTLPVPKGFFKARPCVGSQLFAYNADAKGSNELLVLPGFHLSLNCCLQLKNFPPDILNRVVKLYCILYSSPSLGEPGTGRETNRTAELDYQDCETENIVQMNEKLFLYVTSCKNKRNWISDESNDGTVTSFISFETISRGQGFSNCLLDVSCFPEGSYRIKWNSCFVDDQGSYWSILPLNNGPVFAIRNSCANPDG